MKSLNEVYDGEPYNMVYWCNAVGEINIPWKPKNHLGKEEELPPEIARVYEKWTSFELGPVSSYVITYEGIPGIAHVWLVDKDWWEKEHRDVDRKETIKAAADFLEYSYPYATVFVGDDTDPDGDELILFIPYVSLTLFRSGIYRRDQSIGDLVYDIIAGKVYAKDLMKMRHLDVTIQCKAVYRSGIDVPEYMTIEQAMWYARSHLDDIPVTALEYVPGSGALDRYNCSFPNSQEVKDK